MKKPLWLLNLIADLKKEGKLPAEFVGKITLEVNVAQGGIQDAVLLIPEKIR